jgi:hypothetical protein
MPVAFVLPTVTPPLVHDVRMNEPDDFAVHELLRRAEPDPEELQLTEADDTLRVQLVALPNGMPRRWRRPPAVRLTRGQWLRWQINYRFSAECGGAWFYRLDTLNLAYGLVAADAFLGEPTRYVDDRGQLR